MFFFSFTLLVLPLFLVVCIQMLKGSGWNDSLFGKLLIAVFYIAIFASIATSLYLMTQIGEDSSSTTTSTSATAEQQSN